MSRTSDRRGDGLNSLAVFVLVFGMLLLGQPRMASAACVGLCVVQSNLATVNPASSVTVSLAATPQAGNILIATVASRPGFQSAPSGWIVIGSAIGNRVSTALCWHKVVSGETNGYTFSISSGGYPVSAALFEISGANTVNPVNVYGFQFTTLSTTTLTPTGVGGTLAIGSLALFNFSNPATLGGVSSGWTEQQTDPIVLFTATQNALTPLPSVPVTNTWALSGYSPPFSGSALVLVNPAGSGYGDLGAPL